MLTRISTKHLLLAAFSVVVALCQSPVSAQEHLRAQLFGDVDALLSTVRERKADILAPASYARAMRYYEDASDRFKRGGALEDIRERVQNASDYLARALDVAKIGEVAFSSALAARTDALSADAPAYAPDLWKRAEERFNRAAADMEDGDMGSGNKLGAEATEMYRTAELEAIKTNYLSPARILLEKADDLGVEDTAPKTLDRARQLATRTEAMLAQNRYDTDEARELAQEAKYEAAHAIHLHEAIRGIRKDDGNFEDYILGIEEQFRRIAAPLGFRARFEEGFTRPADDAVAAVKSRDSALGSTTNALTQAAAGLRDREVEIDNLRQQIGSMEKRVGSLTDTERELQERLTVHRTRESTIHDVEDMFTADEGHVIREGGRIIVRLYGLTFPVGKNTIEPQFYPLLTKVQDAIKKFPRVEVVIEGHTDSQGSDDLNQNLSESRARAVAEYLMANMGVELPIQSEGFGESRPLASNDIPEGRAKNRRIDVVITPLW